MATPRQGLGDPGRLGRLAARHDLAAVVASSLENVIYGSGYYAASLTLFIREWPYYVVWPADGTPALVAPSSRIRPDTGIEDVRFYDRAKENPADLVADVLAEKRLAAERIGVELGELSAAAYRTLAARLPEATFADATGVLDEVRVMKTPAEVELLAHAARAAEDAIAEGFDRVRVGQTEKAIADEMVAAIVRRGAQIVPPVALAAGARGWGTNPWPSAQAVVQPGDLLRVDLKGTFAGYQADSGRNAVVRPASPRQRDLYRRLVAIEQRAIDAVRPGLRACDLYEVIRQAYAEMDLPMTWGMFGHSIGLKVHEAPIIRPGETRVLEPGMVLCLEPGYTEVDGEGYNVEDVVLVTEEGHRLLTERRGIEMLREVG